MGRNAEEMKVEQEVEGTEDDVGAASWGTLGASWELPGELFDTSSGRSWASSGLGGLRVGLFSRLRAFFDRLTPSGAV